MSIFNRGMYSIASCIYVACIVKEFRVDRFLHKLHNNMIIGSANWSESLECTGQYYEFSREWFSNKRDHFRGLLKKLFKVNGFYSAVSLIGAFLRLNPTLA